MDLSQCLEDSPAWKKSEVRQDSRVKELYNERHRLALETLVSEGIDSFTDFLKKERIPNFLSDTEVRLLIRSTVVPRCVSFIGEDLPLDHLNSLDCSSVTYFPEISDLEPPVLELGWPAFTRGSFRGVTRAVAYFQPSYGENIYNCKEAARRMIKTAKEVIAIVTDSLTDLDIFQDLKETCKDRCVPVYILLDQNSLPSFLQMCRNLKVQLDDLRHMRVRTLTGSTYYMRSGAHITGRVHERFMLIDGNRVATGSYRFNWTDGKLNSSNLIELSGQITENFDEEFRILYAQSLPLSTKVASSIYSSSIYDCQLLKHPETSTFTPSACKSMRLTSTPNRLTSTPNRAHATQSGREEVPKSILVLSPLNLKGKRIEQDFGNGPIGSEAKDIDVSSSTLNVSALTNPAVLFCHASTQTTCLNSDDAMQIKANTTTEDSCTMNSTTTALMPTTPSSSQVQVQHCPYTNHNIIPAGNMTDVFSKLLKERHHHLSSIRSKLDHMMMMLSQGKKKPDLSGGHYVKNSVLDGPWQ